MEIPNIQEHDANNYEIPFLYTHKVTSLYAYPIINHGSEWYRSSSCIPYDDTSFTIEHEVVKQLANDELGVLLHYLAGDRFCSVYGYALNGLYSESYSHRIVFFKNFALDCIIHRYPKAVGAFTIVTKDIGNTKKDHSFTYIITEEKILSEYPPQTYSMDAYQHSESSNLLNSRRTDIILLMLSEYFGYSFEELSASFDWNKLANIQCKSRLEQDILNYIFPQKYPSVYTEEEVCFGEFINNCICIANVNGYNYRMDADTINKNYNRVLNYVKAFPHFLNKISPKYYNHVSRAFYFTAYHFDDTRINDYLFAIAYDMICRAVETTKMVYMYFLRCSLIEERFASAMFNISQLYPNKTLKEIEIIVTDIELADYLIVELNLPNYISSTDDIAVRCAKTISERYLGLSNQGIRQQVSVVQKNIIEKFSHYINTPTFMTPQSSLG